ncbi:MAG: glycerophosphodiester phosphodiesterase [Roseibacillus sp.]
MRSFFSLVTLLMLSSASLAAPFLVAHRGASKDAPENTLPAFELAWKQGADAIEGDFYLTKDGKIVCFHDGDTMKITGKKLVIKESTLAELQALDVGEWRGKKFAGTRMPTLEQVLATVPKDKKIYIEIKCGPEIVPALLSEVKKSKLHDEQIVVISFESSVIQVVKRQRPQWVANWLYSFKKGASDGLTEELPKVLQTLKEIKADGLSSNSHAGITAALVAKLEAAGFQHHVWTVNDARTARRFLELGTKTVTTDIPERLREQLGK